MNKVIVIKIFLRSLFIHTALNFRRMQNLGFAMSIIPLVRLWQKQRRDVKELLVRHMQMFNTHPYFSAAVIGSVVRIEVDCAEIGTAPDTVAIKQSLAGPYAAIGDIFFWGALKPFAAVFAVFLAYAGLIIAPLAFLLIYTPAHVWVRFKGFIESYRRGKQGIEFIRIMELPRTAVSIRWCLILILAGLVHWLLQIGFPPFSNTTGILMKLTAMGAILACFWLINKGISQVYILYGASAIFLFISWKELLN
jgi:mannose PTS system EIID component